MRGNAAGRTPGGGATTASCHRCRRPACDIMSAPAGATSGRRRLCQLTAVALFVTAGAVYWDALGGLRPDLRAVGTSGRAGVESGGGVASGMLVGLPTLRSGGGGGLGGTSGVDINTGGGGGSGGLGLAACGGVCAAALTAAGPAGVAGGKPPQYTWGLAPEAGGSGTPAATATLPLRSGGGGAWRAGILRNILARDKPHSMNHVLVDADNALAFCSLEKIASSAWRRAMYLLRHPEEAVTATRTDAAELVMHRWFMEYTWFPGDDPRAEELAAGRLDAVLDPAYTASVIVRDPLARFLSGFLNKCVHEIGAGSEVDAHACPIDRRESPSATLDGLLHYLQVIPLEHVDPHFRPQTMFCGLRLLSSHYHVIAFEDMTTGTEALLAAAKLPTPERAARFADVLRRIVLAAPPANPTGSLKSLIPDLLTPERLATIVQVYADDYRLLGYPLPDVLLTS